jgi:hypothetical protein
MNNDLTVAMDTAQELMGGGIPFWDAVFQGLDESGTTARWKREQEERKKAVGKNMKPSRMAGVKPYTKRRSKNMPRPKPAQPEVLKDLISRIDTLLSLGIVSKDFVINSRGAAFITGLSEITIRRYAQCGHIP